MSEGWWRQVPYWVPTSIGHHHRKFRAARTCAPVVCIDWYSQWSPRFQTGYISDQTERCGTTLFSDEGKRLGPVIEITSFW